MKSKLLLLICFLFNINTNAQIEFQEHIVSNTSGYATKPNSVFSADIDNDGDMDVVSASYDDDKIAWYENLNGQGNFGPQQIVTTNANGAVSVYVTDIDGDDDLDIISASSFDDKIAWYENMNGLGLFGGEQVITTISNGARSVYAGDIDGDGDMDVVSASYDDGKVAWYKNIDGLGLFGDEQVISLNASQATSVHLEDIDGDSDLDVLSGSNGNTKIAWYENIDGLGSFNSGNIISSTSDFPNYQGAIQSIYSADIDKDGDMDVLASSLNYNSLAWYKNMDGQGSFSNLIVIATEVNANSVYADDIDGDGDLDVLSTNFDDDKVAWYENIDGLGNFENEHVISTIADGANSVYTSDIDNDGDIDVLSTSLYDYKVAWYKNTDGFGTFDFQQSIVTKPLFEPESIHVSDIDGNGYLDIIGVSHYFGAIYFYKNIDGLGNYENVQIGFAFQDPISAYAADIDNDGDMDLFATQLLGDHVIWFENIDGKGINMERHYIIEGDYGAGPYSVISFDVDKDGDMDAVSTSVYDDKIAWFENTDSLGNFGNQQVITTDVDSPQSICSADIDNDGYIDLVAASKSWSDNKIAWYKNTNALGGFGSKQIISEETDRVNSLYVSDINNDGNIDVIATYLDKFVWYENVDGLGSFGEQQIIGTTTNGDRSAFVNAKDIDDDGDIDIIIGYSSYLIWYENTDGLGSFGEQQTIADNLDNIRSIYTIDFDQDGDIDVLSASRDDDKIAWYENLGSNSLSLNKSEVSSFQIFPNPTKNILNIKSKFKMTKLEIYNNLGQIIVSELNKTSIDISALSTGLYFIKIEDVIGNSETKKIIKK